MMMKEFHFSKDASGAGVFLKKCTKSVKGTFSQIMEALRVLDSLSNVNTLFEDSSSGNITLWKALFESCLGNLRLDLICEKLGRASISAVELVHHAGYRNPSLCFQVQTDLKCLHVLIDLILAFGNGLLLEFLTMQIIGCDASVLLDAINGIESEKEAPPNQSLKGFDMIDMIKSEIELACPATVSCSDILVLATRDAVGLAGGPFYPLLTGRGDSSLSFPGVASFELPAPQDDLTKTLMSFFSRGFDERETVSLLDGGHSIRVIHCQFFRNRLYNYAGSGTTEGSFHLMRTTCNNIESSSSLIQDPTLEEPGVVMDYGGTSEMSFGTHYYQSLVQGRGIHHADQQLMTYEGLMKELLIGSEPMPLMQPCLGGISLW